MMCLDGRWCICISVDKGIVNLDSEGLELSSLSCSRGCGHPVACLRFNGGSGFSVELYVCGAGTGEVVIGCGFRARAHYASGVPVGEG
jgi:hypothetical protein